MFGRLASSDNEELIEVELSRLSQPRNLAVAKFSRDLGVRAYNYNTRNPHTNQHYIE